MKKLELIWDGKYDDNGNRRAIDTPATQPQLKLVELFPGLKQKSHSSNREDNQLVFGDNKLALMSLIDQYKEKVKLIYIDPPFAVGTTFKSGDEIAYDDRWGNGVDSYIHMLYERLTLIKDLLTPDGSILVHVDWHASHAVKLLLDEIFGAEQFMNEIIWYYRNVGLKVKAKRFHNVTESIFWYTKGDKHTYYEVYEERPEAVRQPEVHWDPIRKKTAVKRDENGKALYRQLTDRRIQNLWDIPRLAPNASERVEYDTQKPLSLLLRAIQAFTDEGDLVADLFCGSGTTLIAAEMLNRSWLGCDSSVHSIRVTRERLAKLASREEGIATYRYFELE